MKSCGFILFLIFLVGNPGFAQRQADQDIQDSVIGWWTNNRYDHLKVQTEPVAKKKEAIANEMVKWMKTSYTPVGGLGTFSRYIGNMGYGVNFLVWNVSHDKRWTEPNGKFKPIPEENTPFSMAVNQLFGAFPIYFMNTGKEFYFTIQPDGYAGNTQMSDRRKGSDKRIHPNAHAYITRMNEWCTVYLTPDNKLPWTPVSREELLQKAEDGLQKVMADKRKEVASQWPDNKKAQEDALANFDKSSIERYRNNIQTLRKRYAGKLGEKAIVRSMQTDMYSFETDPDIFRAAGTETGYEVFKLDAATMAKMGEVKPQWLAVAFPFENKESGNQLYEMFVAMSQHVNYDYIYRYFFDPEKNKGKVYTASDAEGLKARLDAYRQKTSAAKVAVQKKQANLPANVILFDDFSGDRPGGAPQGWHFNSRGKTHVVSTIDGEPGNWLKLGYNNELTSSSLKTLPLNFSIEYDMVTSSFDGRWGATVTVELKGTKQGADGVKNTSYIKTSITAGNQGALNEGHDYRGELRMELINMPSKMDYNDMGGYFNVAQPVFTSAKRKVHVQLIKKDQDISVLLNGKEITNSLQFKSKYGKPCGDCNIMPGLTYHSLTIKSMTQDADAVGCYIGNVKITGL